MLTGVDRFIRIVVKREQWLLKDSSADSGNGVTPKSPKLFGLPKPYTSLYSPSSYLANRPNYTGYRSSIGPTTAELTPSSPTLTSQTVNSLSDSQTRLNSVIPTKQQNLGSESWTMGATTTTTTTHVRPQSSVYASQNTSGFNPSSSISNVLPPTNISSVSHLSQSQPVFNSLNHAEALPNNPSFPNIPPPMQGLSLLDMAFSTNPLQKPQKVEQGPIVTVTIQQPNAQNGVAHLLPAPPTNPGIVTESLTKSTYTETTTTRVTHNVLALPTAATEVCDGYT